MTPAQTEQLNKMAEKAQLHVDHPPVYGELQLIDASLVLSIQEAIAKNESDIEDLIAETKTLIEAIKGRREFLVGIYDNVSEIERKVDAIKTYNDIEGMA